jgi:hypothetical protein
MIAPGMKVAGTHWTIVRVDDDGRRTLVQCATYDANPADATAQTRMRRGMRGKSSEAKR